MDIHVCKQCGSHFAYCRKCVFKPVRYKDAGFCSKECYEASKNNAVPVVEEIIVTHEEEPLAENIETIEEVSVDDTKPSIVETTTVVEPTIKNETNTYKKKKNKYKYTSSY